MTSFPIEISFRNTDHSESVEANIREKIEGLERFSDRILSCRVAVEARHRHHHKGHLYDVHITLAIPGRDIQINRTGPENHAHEDVYVAIRDSFKAATRMLEEQRRKMKGNVKTHDTPLVGTVSRLPDAKGEYGFITTADGQEVYFHMNSVVDGNFTNLKEGAEVRLVIAETEGVKGPQASTVKPIGKHHPVG